MHPLLEEEKVESGSSRVDGYLGVKYQFSLTGVLS